jgi:hypothetical protein
MLKEKTEKKKERQKEKRKKEICKQTSIIKRKI